MSRMFFALFLSPTIIGHAQGVSRADALKVLDEPGSVETKAGRLVDHLHRAMPWTSTDYRERTVDEILARGAGNCADHARVLKSLLESRGIQVRWVQELNLQAPSERRQASARAKVAEGGKQYSVFGYRHNDHRWLEVWDPSASAWFPADSAAGVAGQDAWIAARLSFGPRPRAVEEMLVPVFVEAASKGKPPEPRSSAYLIEAFGKTYGGRIRALQGWEAWCQAVRALETPASGAFRGEVDLHEYGRLFQNLWEAYEILRAQALAAGLP